MQELGKLEMECCRRAKEVTEEDSDDDGLDTSDEEGRGSGSLTLE